MDTTTLIQKAFTKATGKSTAPPSSKYAKLLAIANLIKDDWVNEPSTDWASLWDLRTVGIVTAGQATYTLPDTIRKLSQRDTDRIYITSLTGSETYYPLIAPDSLSQYDTPVVTKIGRTLRFGSTFPTGNSLIGGTISAPSFGYLDDMVGPSDEVLVDNPNWLVYMTAAEFVRNSATKQNQYGNLVSQAQDLMLQMRRDNEGSINQPHMPSLGIFTGVSW